MAYSYDKEIEKLLKRQGYGKIIDVEREQYLADYLKCLRDAINEAPISAVVKGIIESAIKTKSDKDTITIFFDKKAVTRKSIYTKIPTFKYAQKHKENEKAFLPLVYNYSNEWDSDPIYYNTKKADPIYGGRKIYLARHPGFNHVKGAEYIENSVTKFKIKYPNADIEINTK